MDVGYDLERDDNCVGMLAVCVCLVREEVSAGGGTEKRDADGVSSLTTPAPTWVKVKQR